MKYHPCLPTEWERAEWFNASQQLYSPSAINTGLLYTRFLTTMSTPGFSCFRPSFFLVFLKSYREDYRDKAEDMPYLGYAAFYGIKKNTKNTTLWHSSKEKPYNLLLKTHQNADIWELIQRGILSRHDRKWPWGIVSLDQLRFSRLPSFFLLENVCGVQDKKNWFIVD